MTETPLDLLLMRHGQAEDYAPGGDADRALTAHGRAQSAAVGRMLRRAALIPTVLCCSPLRRARQTLEAVATAAGWTDVTIDSEARLVPAATPARLVAAIVGAATTDPGGTPAVVLAVGHNPSVSATIASLLGCEGSMSIGASPADLAHLRLSTTRSPMRAHLIGYFPSATLLRW